MKNYFTKDKNTGRINFKKLSGFILLSIIHFSASAQEKTVQVESSTILSNPFFIALLSIIILLLIVIIIYADVVKAAAIYREEQNKKKNTNTPLVKVLLLLFTVGGSSNYLFAQSETISAVAETSNSYWGLDGFTFYFMVSIIALEIFILWILHSISIQFLGVEERQRKEAEAVAKAVIRQPSFLEKMNASVAVEKEADIMLDHDYDGIRELDNNLPPWWKYGFYLTIVWAVAYMIHYHVTKTGKLQLAEYEDQLTQGQYEIDEYRKKAANLIDENNATLLSDAASLNSGKSIYKDNCAACHGQAGEGVVGPNLTDDYWLYKGGIKDIFKIIKYGVPEKGMKSWQQDLGAKQIHEVSSYIMSLQGTNPPNGKEKQGELYIEEAAADSTKTPI